MARCRLWLGCWFGRDSKGPTPGYKKNRYPLELCVSSLRRGLCTRASGEVSKQLDWLVGQVHWSGQGQGNLFAVEAYHANLLCIVPSLTDAPEESDVTDSSVVYIPLLFAAVTARLVALAQSRTSSCSRHRRGRGFRTLSQLSARRGRRKRHHVQTAVCAVPLTNG